MPDSARSICAILASKERSYYSTVSESCRPTFWKAALIWAPIPTELIQRVDVVTGGASSAAYGSDAVAGVLNLDFEQEIFGPEGQSRVLATARQPKHREIKADRRCWTRVRRAAKAILFVSASHTWSNDPVFTAQMNWYNGGAIVQNPAATSTNGLPYYIHVEEFAKPQYTQGRVDVTGNTVGGSGKQPCCQFADRHPIRRERNYRCPSTFGTVDASNP